jgi:light-regulated signal transduction histidine kinase (bacteriophytochrome)
MGGIVLISIGLPSGPDYAVFLVNTTQARPLPSTASRGLMENLGVAETAPGDPRWPKLMSLAVHEFRTPMTVVAGYIRMVLKDRAGPLSDQQRRLLEEAEKSCGRLSALLTEMSELSAFEKGAATFNRSRIDVRTVLRDAAAALPALPDREIPVDVATADGAAEIHGDAVRLRAAFAAVLHGLRREVVGSPALLVRESSRRIDARSVSWIVIGEEPHVQRLEAAPPDALSVFDEWRGGCGLSLPIARRILNAHDASIWSPADGAKAAAVIAVPLDTTR